MNNPQTTRLEAAPVPRRVTPSSPARRGAGQDGEEVTSDAVLGGAASLVTPRVIGLDLSLTSTGIADACETVAIATVTTKKTGATLDDAWQRLMGIDGEIWRTVRHGPTPALIVIEGPSYGSSGAGTWDRAGLWWMVVSNLLAQEIPLAIVPPSLRARYATGKGNAGKAAVCSAAASRYGRMFATDDEADAFVLAAMGRDHLGHPLAALPATHRQALKKVAWPEIGA